MSVVGAMVDLAIAPKVEGKGRTFRAICAGYQTADRLWPGGATVDRGDTVLRPTLAVFFGTEGELRPFHANLQLGREALVVGRDNKKTGLEFLKSTGYKSFWQRVDGRADGVADGAQDASIVTVYLPDLYALDPGMVDPKVIQFVLSPSARWAVDQFRPGPSAIPVSEMIEYARGLPLVRRRNATTRKLWNDREPREPDLPDARLAELAPAAYLFAAYLDRRSRAPIPPDGRFYLQLLLACLEAGLAALSVDRNTYGWADRNNESFGRGSAAALGFSEVGLCAVGHLPGLAFRATHEDLEVLLAEEVGLYMAATSGMPGAVERWECDRLARENARLRERIKVVDADGDAEDSDEVSE